ncbi:MAG: hypothetical protein J0H78_06885 [Rhizobiales bacterium]|nr:hypothetical protein [Hyphomicrobiales bacterium]OJY41692.1 MAG: hypothetical protein BGP08_09925 [Rhizobiales bacterium 64-17]
MTADRRADRSHSISFYRHATPLATLLLIGGMLAACSGLREAPKPIEPNIAPANYKSQLLTEMHRRLVDPVGVRDAFVSAPALRQSGGVERYISCMRYTAKDETGQYAPPTERAAYFYAGEVTQIVDKDASREICRGVAYEPWPELTRMCRQVVCPSR